MSSTYPRGGIRPSTLRGFVSWLLSISVHSLNPREKTEQHSSHQYDNGNPDQDGGVDSDPYQCQSSPDEEDPDLQGKLVVRAPTPSAGENHGDRSFSFARKAWTPALQASVCRASTFTSAPRWIPASIARSASS